MCLCLVKQESCLRDKGREEGWRGCSEGGVLYSCQCQSTLPVSPGKSPCPGLCRPVQSPLKLTTYAPYGPDSTSNFPPSAGPALTHHRKVTAISIWLISIQMAPSRNAIITVIPWCGQNLLQSVWKTGAANGAQPARSTSTLLNSIDIIGMYKERWTERGIKWQSTQRLVLSRIGCLASCLLYNWT